MNNNNVTYFDSFVVEHISKEIKAFINHPLSSASQNDYIDQVLILLNAASGGVSIISFTSIIGAPVGIASASFTLIFFSNNRNS